jgi:hypothetical protein
MLGHPSTQQTYSGLRSGVDTHTHTHTHTSAFGRRDVGPTTAAAEFQRRTPLLRSVVVSAACLLVFFVSIRLGGRFHCGRPSWHVGAVAVVAEPGGGLVSFALIPWSDEFLFGETLCKYFGVIFGIFA